MGYRVEYDSVKKVRGVQKRTAGRLAMTGVFFLVFLVLVACFWPEGASILRDALLPGMPCCRETVRSQRRHWKSWPVR